MTGPLRHIKNAIAAPREIIVRHPWLCALWVGLLVAAVPVFVCRPLTSDVVLYDMQARLAHNGGVLYRDIFETNLPGMIWVHMFVRPIVGDGVVAIRCLDLVIVGAIVALTWHWLRRTGTSVEKCLTAGLLITLFYLSTNVWCHCQRDTWMLLPALIALTLRMNTATNLQNRSFQSSFIEGVVWAIAFWIKPFIAVPAVFCIVASWFAAGWSRSHFRDATAVLCGGIGIGACGILWLARTGAWPWFLDTMTEWNPEYFAAGKSRWTTSRLTDMSLRFQPWIVLHFIAVPVAIASLRRQLAETNERSRFLFAMFYVGWLLQSFTLQHLMDYIHVPAIILAICVIVSWDWTPVLAWRRGTVIAFALLAVYASPVFDGHRLRVWSRCVVEGSSPQVQQALTVTTFPNYENLDKVTSYLKQQGVSAGEVTCYKCIRSTFTTDYVSNRQHAI